MKRAVWGRDGGQCAFVGPERRCTARGFLELHHVEPFALGGPTTVDNLQLRCRAHNAYEAEMAFGSFVLWEVTAPPAAAMPARVISGYHSCRLDSPSPRDFFLECGSLRRKYLTAFDSHS